MEWYPDVLNDDGKLTIAPSRNPIGNPVGSSSMIDWSRR
jgi:hypothetical protein